MKKTLVITALFFGLAVSVLPAQVKVQPRVAGLEADSVYMSLLGQEMGLRAKEDSLNKAVADLRTKLRDDVQNRQKHSENILKLEGEIFDVRNNIGRIAGRTSLIEQEFVLKNLGGGADKPAQAGEDTSQGDISASLTANPYFRRNLSPEDYKALSLADEKERSVANFIRIFDTNYELLSRIADSYIRTDSARIADSLWTKYNEQKHLLSIISDSVETLNNNISDTKTYSYTFLFDLMNKNDLIDEFEEKAMRARSTEAQLAGKSESEPVSAYPVRKRLTLDYETTLAQMLGLNKALDSLRNAGDALNDKSFDYPPVNLEERLFLDYSPITVGTVSPYNTVNPIPPLAVYEKGVIYRILLGSFQRAQPVSVFRNAHPIGFVRTPQNRYDYYAGGFKTQAEAESALEQMKKAGFRAPKIALWNYGEYSLPTAEELSQGRQQASLIFHVEISGVQGDLNNEAKEAIKDAAPGKDIVRIGSKFTVGAFSSADEAEKVAAAIRAADQALEVSTTEHKQ